jgi:1-acyl-sn-glycerol-3-phosphate acyltransferase
MSKSFHSLTGRVIYQASHWASFTAATLGWSLRVAGGKHMPKSGPCLVVANHQSFFDPVFVGMSGRRALTYLARHSLFRNKWMAKLISFYGAVPVNQAVGKEGLNAVIAAIGRQEAVLIFPEGSRTPDGQIHEMMPGITLIIKKVDCPIVPVGIAGAYDAWPIQKKLPKLNPLFFGDQGRSVAVSFGEPFSTAELQKKPREEMLAEIDRRIRACHADAEKIRRRPR